MTPRTAFRFGVILALGLIFGHAVAIEDWRRALLVIGLLVFVIFVNWHGKRHL